MTAVVQQEGRSSAVCTCARVTHGHGTHSMYTKHGCRCFPCRIGAAQIRERWRAGGRLGDDAFVDRRGTRRRIEALHAVGWAESALAVHLQVGTRQAVRSTRTHPGLVLRHTADQVAAVYDRLWDRPPPGRYVVRTLRWAATNGFVPPLGWDDIDNDLAPPYVDTAAVVVDPVAVERLVAGLRPANVTRAELTTAIARMHDDGLTDTDIGLRLAMPANTVGQIRLRATSRELARLVNAGVDLDVAATLTARRSA